MKTVLAICILISPELFAQSTVTGSRTVQGNWDASGASATKPAKAGTSLPGTCSQGEFFFNTAAGNGQNIYLCNPSNSWSQVTPTNHNLLSSTHGDTSAASVARGALITGQGSSATWSFLALGATSRYLRSNGTDLLYSSVAAAGAGACSTGQVMTAGNDNAAPTCSNSIAASTTGNAATATALAATPSQCATNNFATGVAASGNANCSTLPVNTRARAIGTTFSGGGVAIQVGAVSYFTVPFACTISAWNITVDTGTATVDVWKTATGTAIPTVTNTITASALPAISSGTALHGTTLTGWTTAVTANDIIAFQVKTVSGTTLASLVLECDQ